MKPSQQIRFKRPTENKIWLGTLTCLAGLLLNEIPWYRSFGKWVDLLLPIVAFFLAVTGVTWLLTGLLRRSYTRELSQLDSHALNISLLPTVAVPAAETRERRRVFFPVSLLSVPLTVVFGLFYFGMQFIQSGADGIGQCDGLNQAAAATGVIPESVVFHSRPAVGCGNERYGMFLSFYNNMTVYGVTNPADQDRILQTLAEYSEQAHTLPIRLSFYEKENWTDHPGKNGGGWGERGPEKLIRVATLH